MFKDRKNGRQDIALNKLIGIKKRENKLIVGIM